MAVTPLNANARLTLLYQSDLSHRIQALCSIPSSYAGHLVTFSGATLTTAAAAAHWGALLQPFLNTGAQIQSYVLEKFDNGAYIEIDSGSLGLAGTNSNATTPASSATYTFIDSTSIKFRHRILGQAGQAVPFKNGYAALSSYLKAYVDDMVPGGISGKLGDWVSGRNGTVSGNFIFLVGAYNRKARRRLGLV